MYNKISFNKKDTFVKRNKFNYNAKDAASIYFWMLVANILFSLIFVVICTKIALNKGVKAEAILETNSMLYISALIPQILYCGVTLFYSFVQRVNVPVATTVNHKPNWKMALICVAISLACLFGFNYFVGLCDHIIFLITKIAPQTALVGTKWWQVILYVLILAVIPALVEELIFRGVIFNGLKTKYKLSTAIVLSGLLFALMHMSISQFIYQFVLGCLYAVIAHMTGSIVYSMIAHFTNNFTVLMMSLISSTAFTFTKWGFWEIFGTISILLGGVVLVLFLLKVLSNLTKKHPIKKQIIKEDLEEQKEKLKQAEGLSEYEIKQLNSEVFSDKAVLIISFVLGALLWLLSVFG